MIQQLSRWHSNYRIEIIRAISLKPAEYCKRWVPVLKGIHPGERGYRQACIQELSRISAVPENTINMWGVDFVKAPKYIEAICTMADKLNQIRENATFSENFPDE